MTGRLASQSPRKSAPKRASFPVRTKARPAPARRADLAILAADFARKIAIARRSYSGNELVAALAALYSEQRAAAAVLRVRLAMDRPGTVPAARHGIRSSRPPSSKPQRPRRRIPASRATRVRAYKFSSP